MKCPQCGDEIRDGRCVFCGYRPTESDRDAAERYRKQKAALESGSGPPDSPRKARQAKPAGKPDRPRDRGGGREPGKKPQDRNLAKAPEMQAVKNKPEPGKVKKTREKPQAHGGTKRHGFLVRTFFRLLILLWVLAWLFAIAGRLRQDRNEIGPGDFPYGNQEVQSAGGAQEGGPEDDA